MQRYPHRGSDRERGERRHEQSDREQQREHLPV
jgi:hypothetical protein